MTSVDGAVRPDAKSYARPQTAVSSLDRAPRSEWLEVVEVPPGRRASRSLGQVGVSVNGKLRVLSAAPLGGPILVDAGGATVAIGRSLARRITVRLLGRKHKGEST
jgi:Fe2+ transport system protein FeoA